MMVVEVVGVTGDREMLVLLVQMVVVQKIGVAARRVRVAEVGDGY